MEAGPPVGVRQKAVGGDADEPGHGRSRPEGAPVPLRGCPSHPRPRPSRSSAHIREYFLDEGTHVPPLLKRLLAGVESGLAAGIAAELVRRNIVSFSRTFIAGETPAEALPVLKKLWQQGQHVTVDILGEAALSEKEAQDYLDLYLTLIASLAAGDGRLAPP